jgi:hypothetical protein
MSSTGPIYCTNHSNTETLLRCNKCGKPYCIRCLERTPVGYRCRECLSVQRAGYYTVTPVDYAVAMIAGMLISIIGGGIASLLGGIFFIASIFYAPFAGGIIAEVIRWPIQRRRGRYLWLVGCASLVLGGLIGAGFLPLTAFLFSGRGADLGTLLLALPVLGIRAIFNIGFLIYIVLGVGTVYARLRN